VDNEHLGTSFARVAGVSISPAGKIPVWTAAVPGLALLLFAAASIGRAIPAVAIVSLVVAKPLDLGLPPAQTALLGLTLLIGALTLGTGRTTVLQGAIHLVICGFFLLASAVP
jgi:Ca2+/H+ antiporter